MSHYKVISYHPWGGICNTECDISSTLEGVFEIHEVFYDSGRA